MSSSALERESRLLSFSLSLSSALVFLIPRSRVRFALFSCLFIPLVDKSPGAIRHEFVRLLLRFNQTKRYVSGVRTLHAGRTETVEE